MAATLKLYIDTFRRILVTSPTNSQQFTLPPLFQGDIQAVQIQFLEPDPIEGESSYTAPDISNMSLNFAIGQQPTGSAGGPSPFVTQFSWTKDIPNHIFTAEVALNTAGLDAWLASASSRSDACLEVEVNEGTSRTTYLQLNSVTIKAELIESGTLSVAAGLTAISREEANATFLQKASGAGDTWTALSPNGTYRIIYGVNDDGSAKADAA